MKNNLRLERTRKNFRQIDLSLRTGINGARLSMIENGLTPPRAEEMRALAKALALSTEDLFPPANMPEADGTKPSTHPPATVEVKGRE